MAGFLERYLSFHGRLARLRFFGRGVFIGVLAGAVSFASIPFFSSGGMWWWVGILIVVASLVLLGTGLASLYVRRLHDLNLSGYHAIWVGAADFGYSVLSYGTPRAMLLGLPLAAICAWIALWPGSAGANRFGESPD
jgi:uncharacterized membrane protein YhaH (DUF805 family)